MKTLFYILLFLIGFKCCPFSSGISGGTEFFNMVDADRTMDTSRNKHSIKYPILKKQNQLYASVTIMDDADFNYLLIYNTTKSIKSFPCEDGQPRMIQEALDDTGVWRPIEYWMLSTCGMSHYTCSIEPNQYIYFKIRKYSGDFVTKLRVKYKIGDELFYSPIIKGSINKKQFEKPDEIREDQFLN